MIFYLRASVKIKCPVEKTPAAGPAPGGFNFGLRGLTVSNDPKMYKQDTAGKRTHVTSTVTQNLQTISRLGNGKNQSEVTASYTASTLYGINRRTNYYHS
jgi:predicted chitinase